VSGEDYRSRLARIPEFGVSDWAIDRLVARVRVKLPQQNSPYEIVTVRTRGYKLSVAKSKPLGKISLMDKAIDYRSQRGLYSFWMKNGYFKADLHRKKEHYSLLMPHPTHRRSHMGHAMQHAILDAIAVTNDCRDMMCYCFRVLTMLAFNSRVH